VVDPKTGQLDALGKDLVAVNARVAPLGDELMKLGNPTAVYSTPITRTAKDRPTGADAAVPPGLTGVPPDHWVQIRSGEVLCGMYNDAEGRDVVALASHNAYQPQQVVLRMTKPIKGAARFCCEKKTWETLPGDAELQLNVEPYTVELVRVER
jgi:hypothetical protein